MTAATVLLINARARRAHHAQARILRLMGMKGLRPEECWTLNRPEELPERLSAALAAGAQRVILGGGDGTLNSALPLLAHRQVVLGILPLGTSNAFAASLGLPMDLAAAIDVLNIGRPAWIDLGRANRHYFANVASLGLSAAVAQGVSDATKRRFGRLGYLLGGAGVFWQQRPFEVRLHHGDQHEQFTTRELIVANGRVHSGAVVAADARPDNGRLTVFALGEGQRLDLLRLWFAYRLGRHSQLPASHFFTTEAFEIDTSPAQRLDLDGEVQSDCRTPVAFRVDAGALQVLVPPAFGRG